MFFVSVSWEKQELLKRTRMPVTSCVLNAAVSDTTKARLCTHVDHIKNKNTLHLVIIIARKGAKAATNLNLVFVAFFAALRDIKLKDVLCYAMNIQPNENSCYTNESDLSRLRNVKIQ